MVTGDGLERTFLSGKAWSHHSSKGSEGCCGEERVCVTAFFGTLGSIFLPHMWFLGLFLLAGERAKGLGGGSCCSKGLQKA